MKDLDYLQKFDVDLKNAENHIALMTLYRDEWKYRDQTFITLLWKFVFLSLVITFLPNFLESNNMTNELVSRLPVEVHSTLGIVCSLFGLYIGLSENKRITNIDLAYREVEKKLPENYCVKKINKHPIKLRINITLCVVMYSITILLAITNIVSRHSL